MEKKEKLYLKPHHLVDILSSFRIENLEFKPSALGHDVHRIAEIVFNDPDVEFEIELGIDTICLPCKYNVGNKCIDTIDTSYRPLAPKSKNDWNLLIDNRWCEKLGIKQGDIFTAKQFAKMVKEKATDVSNIYREFPADMITRKQEAIQQGVECFLKK